VAARLVPAGVLGASRAHPASALRRAGAGAGRAEGRRRSRREKGRYALPAELLAGPNAATAHGQLTIDGVPLDTCARCG
jgi:hypothetical protein